jgi:hypothetical protein
MKDRFIYSLRVLAIACLFTLLGTILLLFPVVFLIWLFTGINIIYILCDKIQINCEELNETNYLASDSSILWEEELH